MNSVFLLGSLSGSTKRSPGVDQTEEKRWKVLGKYIQKRYYRSQEVTGTTLLVLFHTHGVEGSSSSEYNKKLQLDSSFFFIKFHSRIQVRLLKWTFPVF